jgi:hypothetical protein
MFGRRCCRRRSVGLTTTFRGRFWQRPWCRSKHATARRPFEFRAKGRPRVVVAGRVVGQPFVSPSNPRGGRGTFSRVQIRASKLDETLYCFATAVIGSVQTCSYSCSRDIAMATRSYRRRPTALREGVPAEQLERGGSTSLQAIAARRHRIDRSVGAGARPRQRAVHRARAGRFPRDVRLA